MKIKRRVTEQSSSALSTLPPLLKRIYTARGILNTTEVDYSLKTLLPYHTLKDIEKASKRLMKALQQQERILVIGDFDADGATSTALAVSALKTFGALHIDFLVPNRFQFGYGLTKEIVALAHTTKQPELIITVDNGISSIEGVQAANEAGIDVIITDHHLPAEQLPQAHAIVNPNQPHDLFPSKSIAGVGVIFYVMLSLRRMLVEADYFTSLKLPEPNMSQFLDLVALGTVADVVALDQNNRILVYQGLQRMRQGLCRPGIRALIEIANRDITLLRESDLGFAVAPRLNAAGRLDDMAQGIYCLLSDTDTTAHQLAKTLDTLNEERRHIESEMKLQALEAIEALSLHGDKLPTALCMYEKSWHQGVIGILAGRLKEQYQRPVIAFAKVSASELKGSARSIMGLNIRDLLATIDKTHPKLIQKFGGHAMAAGLSLHPDDFKAFQDAFISEATAILAHAEPPGEILSDGILEANELTVTTAQLLQNAGPWGQAFPEPLFDDIFEVIEQRIVGTNHLKLTLMHPTGTVPVDAIAFNIDPQEWPNHRASKVHVAYKLDINTFRGRTRVQLMINALTGVS